MNITFDNIVEKVRKLSLDEKEEVKFLLEKSIIEQRRDDIYKNYLNSKKEFKKKKLNFSNNLDELKQMVEKE